MDGGVEVTMDAAAGGFNAADCWTNDIAGAGRPVKSGSGALTLSGNNGYRGGTIVRDGTLVASSADALGAGGVLVAGGTVSLVAGRDVAIGGDYTQSGGALAAGTRFDVIAANGVTGTFVTIDAGNVKVRPVYNGSSLSVIAE